MDQKEFHYGIFYGNENPEKQLAYQAMKASKYCGSCIGKWNIDGKNNNKASMSH